MIIFAILVVSGSLVHPLWGDEAETALFARNILTYGVPKGWDGVNIMGINNAVVLDKNLVNHTSPWAQYYITAVSFALFGQNSFTARLPFSIISIISLPFLWYMLRRVTKNPFIATTAVWIAAVSVPFILFSFQDRYYAVTSIAALGVFYCSWVLLTASSLTLRTTLGFIVSSTIFFYGNYVCFIAFYSATFVSLWLYGLKSYPIRRFVLRFLLVSIPVVGLTAPWYVLLKPFESRGTLELFSAYETVSYLSVFFRQALAQFNLNNAFPWICYPIFIGVICLLKWKKYPIRPLIPLVLVPLVFLFIMSAFTLVANVDTSFMHIRYTMLAFPFFCAAMATIVYGLYTIHPSIAAVFFIVYISTNIFTLTPFRSFWLDFAGEVMHPYQTPDKVVADYLNEFANDGDTAFVNLDRDHEPLIFHLGKKIRFVNRVSLVNTRIFPENRTVIPRYIYDFREYPDWIILFSKRGYDGSFYTFDYRSLNPEVKITPQTYTEHVLPVFFSDVSRPEIELRMFHAPDFVEGDYIYVYHKKK